MEELTENAEEPDDGDSKKEEQKLGKLQYKVSANGRRTTDTRERERALTTACVTAGIRLQLQQPVCDRDTGGGAARSGHGRHLRPLRQSLPAAG